MVRAASLRYIFRCVALLYALKIIGLLSEYYFNRKGAEKYVQKQTSVKIWVAT